MPTTIAGRRIPISQSRAEATDFDGAPRNRSASSSRHRGKAPTIHDVAAAAGVSKSTVSNVARGAEEVSKATRARVQAAIAHLSYKPNAIARQFVNVFSWTPGAAEITSAREARDLGAALRGRDAPTALFVSNNIGAIAFIEAREQLGLEVPGDVSVVGFDDIALAALHRISLTTVAQSLDAQAERAVGLLLERIENPRLKPRHESAEVQLRVRGSATPPRSRRRYGPRS